MPAWPNVTVMKLSRMIFEMHTALSVYRVAPRLSLNRDESRFD
jgi:hypothetical protein